MLGKSRILVSKRVGLLGSGPHIPTPDLSDDKGSPMGLASCSGRESNSNS